MLDLLDQYLCGCNTSRKRSLIMSSHNGIILKTFKDRTKTRIFKKKVVTATFGFFDIDKIMIPVHDNSHWTLYVIFIQSKDIVHYDSLALAEPTTLTYSDILAYLEDEACAANIPFLTSEWSYLRATVINQVNTLDCGFCVIKHGILVMHDLPLNLQVRIVYA